MKRINVILVLVLMVSALRAESNLLYDITDGVFRPQRPAALHSMKDGEHYTLISNGTTILKYSYRTGKVTDTLLHLPSVKEAPLEKIEGYILSPKESKILVYINKQARYRRSYTADYYIYDIKYKEFDPLSANRPQEAPVFSPDDRYIAFAHKNNLYMKKVDFKTDIQITKDGAEGKISNGIADWAYEEEFGATCYYEWSPDSKLLAFVKFDESKVKEFSFQNFLGKDNKTELYPGFLKFKYPKAGEINSTVSVCIYDDFNKTTRVMKLLDPNPDSYVPRIKWSNDTEKLMIYHLNRQQNKIDMLQANPRTGISRLLLRREDKAYVDYQEIDETYFTSDNRFFYTISDKDGYRHIYQHRMDGTVFRQITKGKWDVTAFYGVDERRFV